MYSCRKPQWDVLHKVIHSYQKTPYLLYMWVKVVLEIEHYEKVDALTVVLSNPIPQNNVTLTSLTLVKEAD